MVFFYQLPCFERIHQVWYVAYFGLTGWLDIGERCSRKFFKGDMCQISNLLSWLGWLAIARAKFFQTVVVFQRLPCFSRIHQAGYVAYFGLTGWLDNGERYSRKFFKGGMCQIFDLLCWLGWLAIARPKFFKQWFFFSGCLVSREFTKRGLKFFKQWSFFNSCPVFREFTKQGMWHILGWLVDLTLARDPRENFSKVACVKFSIC